jgi:hypothetical protein
MTGKHFDLLNPANGVKTELQVRSGTIGPDVLDLQYHPGSGRLYL